MEPTTDGNSEVPGAIVPGAIVLLFFSRFFSAAECDVLVR